MTDVNKLSQDLFHSARQFARFGLATASSAIGFAAEVLKDVQRELKVSSERLGTDAKDDETAVQPRE